MWLLRLLSDDVGNDNLEDLLFRFETWNSGKFYCGENDAADTKRVNIVYQDLKENWPSPKFFDIEH